MTTPRNLTPEQLDRERILREHRTRRAALIVLYGSVCNICGQPETRTDDRELCISLRPSTDQVRGLLCSSCNLMLGHASEDQDLLAAAGAYLRRHRELHATTPNPYERFQSHVRSVPSRVHPRTEDVLTWRNSGMTFKEIGRRLGVTRQRATQLWEAAQSAIVLVCWCGELVPLVTRPGRPNAFCRPEHAAHNSELLAQSQFEELMLLQSGKCAVCAIIPKQLCIDHDHETERVRELLCKRCNSMLGAGKDNPDIFDLGIIYLGK